MQSPTQREAQNFMFGYSLHIRALREEDVRIHKVDLGDSLFEDCVAVHGADLGECLAAVIDANKHRLIWSDADGQGSPVFDAKGIVNAVIKLGTTFLPVEPNALD